MFDDEEAHERLRVLPKVLIQSGLDVVLQYSKDTKLLSPTSESNLIVVLQHFFKETGGLPARFDLAGSGLTISGPVKAKGGSANIYQGYIKGQVVCVKKIRCTKDKLDKFSKMMLDSEVILCGYLPAHPNILPFLGVYREGNTQSLVYPWMENGDLVSYLKRHPDSNRVDLINILVNNSGRACIADFGLSSILPGFRGGTPRYQAPELFKEEYNTKATDIYAIGCVAYEVFTGQKPFSEVSNIPGVVIRVSQGYRPKRPDNNPSWTAWGLTEDLWTMVQGCWKADPVERPTIEGIIQSLEQALAQGRRADEGSV
ncbi:hypothetical protein H0H92_008429 [Tricholoma furcatifolium]|nr:hypothetical protein H0H92_008429 [Tricholoma furcatifolium]